MALKVVAAGDERCDIHNGRKPPKYICKDCIGELGVEAGPTVVAGGASGRRARRILRSRPVRRARRRLRRSRPGGRATVLTGAGIVLVAAAIALVAALSGGGGAKTVSGPPTEAEVVEALGLSPNPSGQGWITLDGACAVLSIQTGRPPTGQTVDPKIEASNEDGTVRAIVEESFSQNQAACVDRISSGLRDNF